MKKLLYLMSFIALVAFTSSCTTVDSKERGVCKSYGGSVDTKTVYGPGMHWGLHWIVDKMVTQNVARQTVVEKYSFNDANQMETGVEVTVDFNLDPEQIGALYVTIDNWKIKLDQSIKNAAKEVIPQYSAADLNLTKRVEAEGKLSEILARELPGFYLAFARVRLTDVDIPKAVSDAAMKTATQAKSNELALSKAIEAENNYKAAEWDAKSKAILSQPQMLELKRLDIQMEYAKKGVSPYGTNNVFGTNPSLLLNR